MSDYDALIKAMRVCGAGTDCTCCPMYGEEEADDGVNSFCSARRAADAIEELLQCLGGVEADNDSLCEKVEELQGQIDGWIGQERKALIKSLPRWIPVTERLPDKRDWYLVLTYDLEYFVCDYIPSVNQWWALPGDDWIVSVTHWQPLPAPQKEETE